MTVIASEESGGGHRTTVALPEGRTLYIITTDEGVIFDLYYENDDEESLIGTAAMTFDEWADWIQGRGI